MDLILNLSKEELRNFKLSLKRTYGNILDNPLSKLVDAYRSKKYKNDHQILENVFNNLNKNAFYKLKNKLQHEVYKSLLILNYGKNDVNTVANLFLLARIFFTKANYDEAYKLLKSAAKKAEELEAYDMLLCVLNDLLRLGLDYNVVNIPEILNHKKKCINKLTEINYIKDRLAEFVWKLKKTHPEHEDTFLLTELENIENEIEQNESLKKSTTLQIQLQVVVRHILLQKNDYLSLINYLKYKIEYFNTNRIFNNKNYRQKIIMQVWIINALYRLLQFKKVISEADILETYLNEHKKMYLKTFYWTLIQSKSVAYYYLNKPKQAIAELQKTNKNFDIIDTNEFQYPIQFNFAVIHFSIKQYETGHRYLFFLNNKAIEKVKDKELLLNVKILDILFYFELKDYDFATYKISQLKDKHKLQLRKPEYYGVKQFINILQKFLKKQYFTVALKTTCLEYINTQKTVFTNRGIRYTIWLQAKLNKEDYYPLLLRKISD